MDTTHELRVGVAVHTGTYCSMPGPVYETRAEIGVLRRCGGDAVGMSTVPEVIVAAQVGLRVVGFSAITDLCLPDALEPANIPKIIATAKETDA